MSAREKMLAFLRRPEWLGWGNTFSVAQARAWYGIQNVSARIHELREEGWPIYTNVRTRGDGSKVFVYRMGTPSRSMKAAAKARGVRLHRGNRVTV